MLFTSFEFLLDHSAIYSQNTNDTMHKYDVYYIYGMCNWNAITRLLIIMTNKHADHITDISMHMWGANITPLHALYMK